MFKILLLLVLSLLFISVYGVKSNLAMKMMKQHQNNAEIQTEKTLVEIPPSDIYDWKPKHKSA